MIPLSLLDLAPVTEGRTPADTFRHTLDLARRAEALGYRRFCSPNTTTCPASPAPPPRC